jgi:phosphonopyruvate decarboxylase
MIEASAFLDALLQRGYSHFAGVPCSFLKPFINFVIDSDALDYVGAASEGEAVGISLGSYLAGAKTVTLCQNSGLGNMVNPLTSLNYPFQVPTLLITTLRGAPDIKDEPQHEQMGRITGNLLDALEIPHAVFPSDDGAIGPALNQADSFMSDNLRPFAFVMEKGTVAPYTLTRNASAHLLEARRRSGKPCGAEARMTRTRALEILLEELRGDEAVIATTGKTGRELFTLSDRPGHLYVVGGMGTASAIGFGITRVKPNQPVVILDGDGAALMKLGVLATIGISQPKKFLHVLLDNGVHDSTGGQATASSITDFASIAAACNYASSYRVEEEGDLRAAARELRASDGPALLHVRINPGSPKDLGRPTVKPPEVKGRFMEFLKGGA